MFGFGASNRDAIKIVSRHALRKEGINKRLRYYWDDSNQDTLALIARRFANHDQFRIFTVNIVRAITDKRASTYRLPPRRTFTGMDQVAGDELYKAMNADAVLKKASRYLELCKTVALQVDWDEDTAKPVLRVITPNNLDVIYRDPSKPTRVIVTYPGDTREDTTYADWTSTGFARLDHRGSTITTPANPAGVNPYGVLPFVPWFDRLPDNDFFLPGGADLFEAQDAINVGLSNLWRAVEMQAHGQAWASGIGANEILQFGPDRVVALPANGQFGFASPNAPISTILSAIEFVLRETAATYGVGSDLFDLSKVAESGSAKHAGRLDLKEVRQDQIAQARTMEARLFETLKAVVNTHAPGTIPDGATVGIDFAEQQDQLSEAEALENAQIKTELGVWSPVDVLMDINPDGYPDRQSAFAELMRRRDEAQQLSNQI
ncbi:phage portal protein [Sphingobium yanoikuyae]|uniref:phage portal protein n=2 Tax=Sphingobium yanoikuyae TaxID=13690 RepID=UPI000A6AC1F3|nr:phage portal protein [Sphingobium yanoikuyae]MDV3479185.1 phage portal protein [Sphingobium yanoikuyae]